MTFFSVSFSNISRPSQDNYAAFSAQKEQKKSVMFAHFTFVQQQLPMQLYNNIGPFVNDLLLLVWPYPQGLVPLKLFVFPDVWRETIYTEVPLISSDTKTHVIGCTYHRRSHARTFSSPFRLYFLSILHRKYHEVKSMHIFRLV